MNYTEGGPKLRHWQRGNRKEQPTVDQPKMNTQKPEDPARALVGDTAKDFPVVCVGGSAGGLDA